MSPVEQPKGLLGRKKRLEEAQAQAEAHFDGAMTAYRERMEELPGLRESAMASHAMAEAERQQALGEARARYAEECRAREEAVAEANAELDSLIANLGYGTVDAVQEYVAIVLANSSYPEHFPVDHHASFDPETAELQLSVRIPPPDQVPTTKHFKYVKSKDQITETAQSQKASKDRYLGAVQAVALRSLHEMFEADRRGLIQTISLTVGTDTIDPALGTPALLMFAAVGAERESFLEIELAAIEPSATLDHLGAVVSKNPHGLVTIDPAGVRRR
jgi:restriction system protein